MKLETRINKEIRNYSEQIFFGMNLRETFFSAAAVVASITTYFAAIPYFHVEIVSWLCILAAAPFGFLGFFHWHELSAEQIAMLLLKEACSPRIMLYKSRNVFYELEQEVQKRGNQNTYKIGKKTKKSKKKKDSTGSDSSPERKRWHLFL
ncbi:PrgI family protein [Zhenpiania hominis]|uniref:PrgI family protein n=1 Tax=Zhenpiania hominis TaxID=2763644 RepID=A0A923SQE8_9FIRM|nr:PrgI family protein [Zhenpiania hominis]MBC6679557.1 PrgI family protein [Zhenpiania hominis]